MPAAKTSLGRALLADMADVAVVDRLDLSPGAERTSFLKELAATRSRGYSLADGAQEPGLVLVGAPIRGVDGEVIAAMAIATHTSRHSVQSVEVDLAPQVVDAAGQLQRRWLSEAERQLVRTKVLTCV